MMPSHSPRLPADTGDTHGRLLPPWAPGQRRQVGGGQARENGVIGVVGAGRGLGASFAPRDEREITILRHGLALHPQLSYEQLLCEAGLELIHRALCGRAGAPAGSLSATEITRRALGHADALCEEALQAYCGILGTAAANQALALGALGGVYIVDDIVAPLGGYFERSPFRERFEDQGRHSGDLRTIPTFVVTAEHAALVEGVAALLNGDLRTLNGNPGAAILGQIQRAREGLTPAEKRVADQVLAHPRSVLNDPIAEIAKAAQVSQPTVIRFCRSLGCDGLSDFKLRLASGLSATLPLTHAQVTGADTVLELGVKVLGNTAGAILQAREQLNRDTLVRAIELLNAAERVDFHAVGHDGVVADDAQLKFLCSGVPSASFTDTRLQRLAAQVLRPSDVVVIISGSGRGDELLMVCDAARARAASVVAITTSQSPLARKADVALLVDHGEDVATQLPMVSRILHLLVIDILAVGLAARRGGPGPGTSGPLSRLTSHSR